MFRSSAARWSGFLILLLCTTGAGCERTDPMESIRHRQASGDIAGTIEPLREILEERPGDAEVEYLYGRALALTGQTSLAEWSLRAAMDDPDWLLPAGMQLAFGALATRNYAHAVDAATRVLEAHPDSVEMLVLRANAHAHSKLDPEAALADVDRVLELDPENLEAMEPRILALLSLERIDDAAEAIAELGRRIDAADTGESVPAWHCATTAIFADENGEPELAEERWTQCLELHPANGNVVTGAIDFYDGQQKFDRSLEILRRAQDEQPDSRDYRVTLAVRLRAAGKVDEAEALLQAATANENLPVAAAAWLDLATHQQALEDFSAAAKSVGEAVAIARQLESPSAQLLFQYADALLLAGEFEPALALAEEIEVPAHQAMIRARVAQDRGQYAEALAYFDEGFRLWPDNAWARYMAALAAEALGDFDRAIDLYRYAIRIAAAETDSRVRVARILIAEGNVPDALPLLRFNAVELPLDLEGELFSVRAWARAGQTVPVGRYLEMFRRGNPQNLGRALAAAAEGTAVRSGPEAGEALMREWESVGQVDFTRPEFYDALRSLVRLANACDRGAAAEKTARAAVAAAPDVAGGHAILGLALEMRGAPAPEVRAVYARALELDEANAHALAGMGRLALAEDPAAALAYFDRALAADPKVDAAAIDSARALAALDRGAEAEERLREVLEGDPTDLAAVEVLIEIRLARGDSSERTVQLANQAIRFGGGAEAIDRLSRVQLARGEEEAASETAARAEKLREAANGEG